MLWVDHVRSPLGTLTIVASDDALCALAFRPRGRECSRGSALASPGSSWSDSVIPTVRDTSAHVFL